MFKLIRDYFTEKELSKQPQPQPDKSVSVKLPEKIDQQATLAREELAQLDEKLAEIQQLARQSLLLRQGEVVTRSDIADV